MVNQDIPDAAQITQQTNPKMKASHVIIRGLLFPYEEKAPFVPSGYSVLGAIEYNERAGKAKCHECGEWHKGLGYHVGVHGLKRREYNERHGLRLYTALSSLSTRRKLASSARRQNATGAGLSRVWLTGRKTKNSRCPTPNSNELANEQNRCAAQLLFRLQAVSAKKQRTPTVVDMEAAGIRMADLKKRFGSTTEAMRIIGLIPNRPNCKPQQIPPETSERWETRMPWPDDYFGVDPLRQKTG